MDKSESVKKLDEFIQNYKRLLELIDLYKETIAVKDELIAEKQEIIDLQEETITLLNEKIAILEMQLERHHKKVRDYNHGNKHNKVQERSQSEEG